MDYRIERLRAGDYDELLAMMNRVFRKPEGNTFDIFLPVMWERDDERMSKHLAIRADGKIAAVVGIYPLPAVVAGIPVAFSTIGNVATLPEYEGRGMMKRLMTEAVREAKETGLEVARLSGARQRYNRYGFDKAGVDHLFRLRPKNLLDFYGGKRLESGETVYAGSPFSGGVGFERALTFRQVGPDDGDLLSRVMELQKQSEIYALRGDAKQFFKTLSAYKSKILAAIDREGDVTGYLCASESGADIVEHRAGTPFDAYRMICEWLLCSGVGELTVRTASFETELNRLLGRICESWTTSEPSMFNPLRWENLLRGLLKIKAKYTAVPETELTLKVEGDGIFTFRGAECRETDNAPDLALSHLDAVRFLLGSLPAQSVADIADADGLTQDQKLYIQSVFPLPLWWCNQDRV